jgi:hypothetical protein
MTLAFEREETVHALDCVATAREEKSLLCSYKPDNGHSDAPFPTLIKSEILILLYRQPLAKYFLFSENLNV